MKYRAESYSNLNDLRTSLEYETRLANETERELLQSFFPESHHEQKVRHSTDDIKNMKNQKYLLDVRVVKKRQVWSIFEPL